VERKHAAMFPKPRLHLPPEPLRVSSRLHRLYHGYSVIVRSRCPGAPHQSGRGVSPISGNLSQMPFLSMLIWTSERCQLDGCFSCEISFRLACRLEQPVAINSIEEGHLACASCARLRIETSIY
jgi:hypothetical protein